MIAELLLTLADVNAGKVLQVAMVEGGLLRVNEHGGEPMRATDAGGTLIIRDGVGSSGDVIAMYRGHWMVSIRSRARTRVS